MKHRHWPSVGIIVAASIFASCQPAAVNIEQGHQVHIAAETGERPSFSQLRALTATVLKIDRSRGRVRAEIDAGAKDGLRPGDHLVIGNEGSFIARLILDRVDANRSSGVISLESPDRGAAQAGYKAHFLVPDDRVPLRNVD
jgi:hypothetical protein